MRLLRSIISNLATLIISLILAIIIWAAAVQASDPVESQLFQVDVEVIGLPADGQLETQPPGTAQITVQAASSVLAELSPTDFHGVIDLSEVPFGQNEVPITIEGLGDRVELVSHFPETAVISMEQIITRAVPVFLETRGEVARGHRAAEPQYEPQEIEVTGSASRVAQLSEARLTVSIDNASEDINVLRRPLFYDLQGSVASIVGLTLNPNEVEVIIPVNELAGFAEKPITVNWVGEPAQSYRLLNVTVEPSSVQVTGRPTQLELLSRLQTEEIDITGLTESLTLPAVLDLPEGITLEDVQPVIVTFEIEPIVTSEVVRETVEIRALGEGLTATLEPEEVLVFLFGPLPALESLDEEDVRVTVDLLNLGAGTHTLEPVVSVLASGVEHRSTQPSVITVNITQTITTTEGLTGTQSLTETSLLPLEPLPVQGAACLSGACPTAVFPAPPYAWPPAKIIF